MIWRVVARYAELSGVTPLLDPQATYAMFDGLFEKALLGYLSGDARGRGSCSRSGCTGCFRRSARPHPLGRLSVSTIAPRAPRPRYPGPMTYRSLLLGQPR